MNWEQLGSLLWTGTVDTLYMTFWSSVIAYLQESDLPHASAAVRRGPPRSAERSPAGR
mgnify:CR=1 FL=1